MNKRLLGNLIFKYHPHNVSQSNLHPDSLNQDYIVPRKNIRLLTYNMYMRPPPVKTNESDHKDARLEEFIKRLEDYDIVCN